MLQGIRTVVYHVKDLVAAKEWYTKLLGKGPYFDEPFYVGYNVGGFELGLNPNEMGEYFGNNAVAYWGVKDANAAYKFLIENGSIAKEPVRDVGEGILLGTVIDPAGNMLEIIENPHFVYTYPEADFPDA